MEPITIKFEVVEEGVGFGMSELKEYVLPEQFTRVSPWAGRWNEYFKARLNEQVKEEADDPTEQRTD